jgi:hypothetical protein
MAGYAQGKARALAKALRQNPSAGRDVLGAMAEFTEPYGTISGVRDLLQEPTDPLNWVAAMPVIGGAGRFVKKSRVVRDKLDKVRELNNKLLDVEYTRQGKKPGESIVIDGPTEEELMEQVGLSADEIVEAIKESPDEADELLEMLWDVEGGDNYDAVLEAVSELGVRSPTTPMKMTDPSQAGALTRMLGGTKAADEFTQARDTKTLRQMIEDAWPDD